MAGDNKSLGKFSLDGIPPAPRGVPQIEVAFDIDADGIMNVSAQDKATGREQKITITASSGLADEEIERMVKESEQFAAEDQSRKEEIEVRNNADQAAYTADKFVRDYAEQLPDDAKQQTEEKVQSLREALAGTDLDRIRSETDEMMQHIQTLGAQMYEAQADTETDAPPSGDEGVSGDDVVEGEVVEP
jgi:molecular chaperone DnaK